MFHPSHAKLWAGSPRTIHIKRRHTSCISCPIMTSKLWNCLLMKIVDIKSYKNHSI